MLNVHTAAEYPHSKIPIRLPRSVHSDWIIFAFLDTMFPCTDEGYYCHDSDSHYVETWKAMEALVDKGKAKSIGLSNFNRTQVQEVLNIPGLKYKPAVLQNESHPYLQEKDLRDFCSNHGIAFQVSTFTSNSFLEMIVGKRSN